MSAPKPAVNERAAAYERTAMAASPQILAQYPAHIGLSYGPEPYQTLDVFAPAGRESLPVVIFFHGGGFTHGCAAWNHFMAPAMLATPCVFISADYRLLEVGGGGVPLTDVVMCLRWAKDNITRYGGSPDRIVLGGHSAGAGLVAAAALREDLLAQQNLQPSDIAGLLCLSSSMGRFAISGTAGSVYELPGGPLPVDADAPLALISAKCPPMLIGWGGRERQRPRVERSSMKMISALEDLNVPVEWLFLSEADHFGTHLALAEVDHPWSVAIREWLSLL